MPVIILDIDRTICSLRTANERRIVPPRANYDFAVEINYDYNGEQITETYFIHLGVRALLKLAQQKGWHIIFFSAGIRERNNDLVQGIYEEIFPQSYAQIINNITILNKADMVERMEPAANSAHNVYFKPSLRRVKLLNSSLINNEPYLFIDDRPNSVAGCHHQHLINPFPVTLADLCGARRARAPHYFLLKHIYMVIALVCRVFEDEQNLSTLHSPSTPFKENWCCWLSGTPDSWDLALEGEEIVCDEIPEFRSPAAYRPTTYNDRTPLLDHPAPILIRARSEKKGGKKVVIDESQNQEFILPPLTL